MKSIPINWEAIVGGSIGILLLIFFFFLGTQKESVTSLPPLVSTATATPQQLETKETDVPSAPLPPETLITGVKNILKSGASTQSAFQYPPELGLNTVNENARAAAVNIFCTPSGDGRTYGSSGSGIIIDPRGIILTNAHVAYNFLLRDYPEKDSLSCVIRTKSPAVATYNAELIFFPFEWVASNAKAIASSKPLGTGENDYAFLVITEKIDGTPLPSVFPFIPFSSQYSLPQGSPVVVAGYPAGFLSSSDITRALPLTSVFSSVRDVYTFDTSTVDLLSLGGSAVAQQGVSGSAVVDAYGNLAALAVTATLEGDTSTRDLRAITTGHIARSFKQNSDYNLTVFFSADPLLLVDEFKTKLAPLLTPPLEEALKDKKL